MRQWMAWACLLPLWAAGAHASPNDLQIYHLGCPSAATCGTLGVDGAQAQVNNDNFRIFAREFAAALTSANLMPPSSLGADGFTVDAELSLAFLNSVGGDASQCPAGKPCFLFPNEAQSFSGPLLLPSVHIRKGLPWSFELGARVAWIDKTAMAAGTIEAKWSVNEGFAYLPDIGIRGYGTRLFNTRDFDLTAAGLDIGVGKRFAIGGMVTLTPYMGWNLVWVAAVANNVDFQPGRTLADSESSQTAQLTNTGVFDEVTMGSNAHNRIYGGMRFVGGNLQLTAEVSYAFMGGFTDAAQTQVSMPNLLAINMAVGLNF
jgi:hypothetical protein